MEHTFPLLHLIVWATMMEGPRYTTLLRVPSHVPISRTKKTRDEETSFILSEDPFKAGIYTSFFSVLLQSLAMRDQKVYGPQHGPASVFTQHRRVQALLVPGE